MTRATTTVPLHVLFGTLVPTEQSIGRPTRAALRALLREAAIDGVRAVLLLSSEARYEHAHDKVFFILETRDIDRDERIVRLMSQFEAVDYDLVPVSAAGMVPSAAHTIG